MTRSRSVASLNDNATLLKVHTRAGGSCPCAKVRPASVTAGAGVGLRNRGLCRLLAAIVGRALSPWARTNFFAYAVKSGPHDACVRAWNVACDFFHTTRAQTICERYVCDKWDEKAPFKAVAMLFESSFALALRSRLVLPALPRQSAPVMCWFATLIRPRIISPGDLDPPKIRRDQSGSTA